LLVLARQGQATDSRAAVPLAVIVENCLEMVGHANATLVVVDDLTFAVAPDRLQRPSETLFRNAIEHGDDVTIRIGTFDCEAVYVDGPNIFEEQREAVFDSACTTNRADTGFGLPIAKEIGTVAAGRWL